MQVQVFVTVEVVHALVRTSISAALAILATGSPRSNKHPALYAASALQCSSVQSSIGYKYIEYVSSSVVQSMSARQCCHTINSSYSLNSGRMHKSNIFDTTEIRKDTLNM
eukprot:3361-Heterococcus_DN1.PRE.3